MIRLGGGSLFLTLAVSAAVACTATAADLLPADPPATTCRAENGHAAAFGGRRTFLLQPHHLTVIKADLATDPLIRTAYTELLKRADAALARKPGSVMDKTTIPLSDDRRDYISLAPYWWPDPANPKGPYVRRDGEFNPRRDTRAFDRTAIGRLGADSEVLGLAYFYTGDARYAAKAAAVIRAWFLDPATAMNPNMNYAQAVPGRENGRPEGVLDSNAFQPVIETIGLIAPSGALAPAEVTALEAWFGRYVDWLQKSANGKGEAAAKNNHGIWYDGLLTHYALFARRPDIARRVVTAFPKARIAAQFDPSGRLPAELGRTRSLHYSIFALAPAYDVATLAACLGEDLWGYADSKGRGLRGATLFLAGYRGRIEAWPYKEIKPDPAELDDLLLRASHVWPDIDGVATGYPSALKYRR